MLTLVILTLAVSIPLPLLAHRTPRPAEDSSSSTQVYPQRIDHRGLVYPRALQFRRKEQSPWYGKTRYRLQHANRTWLLELQPLNQLPQLRAQLSPKLKTKTLAQAGCYYKGWVVGERFSSVKVSLCGGMTGDIHLSSADYVIHPTSFQEDPLLPHHLSLLRHPDPHRAWRPLHAQDLHFCDVTDESPYFERQEQESSHPQSFPNASSPLIRRKRSESRELHLEVLVVADSKMAAYHGDNLNHYILTLMSTVALIYKDPSIGNNINIAVVDILVLNETSDAEVIHPIAPLTLRNFCRWQHRHNKADDRDPGHYDTAVLITREDLCRFPGACDTLGLAQSGMVCDLESSCAIVEDNGLSAAFTIAHELGHVMSIPHDDDSKCSSFHSQKKRLHVMARMLDYNSHPWSWSECSRSFLTNFFDVGYGRCLTDPPGRNRLLLDDEFQQPPGQLYSKDRQCELVFSRKSRICPYMPECKRLWCTMDDTAQGGCRTQHMPWADGTQCDEGKRCYQGECLRYRPAHLTPMDGQWGHWAPYGKCSRTCGGGVQQRLRECDSPKPSNGGRYCIGVRVQYKSCNIQECPAGSRDFRTEQCAEFNNRNINIPGLPRTAKWIPQFTGIPHAEKCKLYCKINESSSYYVLRESVIDGTPCDVRSFDICVNGKCEPAGCDHILQSNITLDRCGVCGGLNNTCKEIKGNFNKKVDYGYHNVVMIPSGASNIRIQQSSTDGNIDDNYIALKERNSKEKYLLNGDFMISMFPKTIEYHGVMIDYSGSHSVTEQVNCSEPISKDLFVEVLVVGKLQAPNISFSYTVPLSNEDLYTWKLATQFSECSRLCNGISSLKPICIRLADQYPVNDNHCMDIPKPSLLKARKCNEHCNLKWKDVGKNKCSVECGRGKIHKIIKCMKEEISAKVSHAVPEEHCLHLGPKPSSQDKCWGSCSNSFWVYSDWSECSVTCGKGLQRRTVECLNSENVKQPESNCDATSKVLTKVCNQGACPKWKLGNWTECSVTCGTGVKERPFWCQHEDKYVDVRYCKESEIPVTKEACHVGNCYYWSVEVWEECRGQCGNGTSNRAVYCRTSDIKVDDSFCSHFDRPPSSKVCYTGTPCNHLHTKKKHSPRHQYKNWKSPNQAMSDTNSIPEFNRAVWKEGKWNECSNACGEGIRRRTVTCHDVNDDSRLALSYCDSKRKPKTSEKCSGMDCSHWEFGEWLECSVSCGNGIKRRQVVCYNINGTRERSSDCDIRRKPSEIYECNNGPCPDWLAGDWSECSASCGEGSQFRSVQCFNDNEEKVSESLCSPSKKPVEKQSCIKQKCPDTKHIKWILGPWSQCSTPCGDGIQLRNVFCLNDIGHEEYEHLCPKPKPALNQSCNLGPCPTWNWSEWSECPKKCGFHEQYRQPRCIQKGKIVDDKNCFQAKPPEEKRRCKVSPECTFTWRSGIWSQCSARCGKTFKIREVFCVDSENNRVSENLCLSRGKPPKKRKKCNLKPCPYMWITSEWSECSKSCNEGIRQRKVSCHAVNDYGWVDPKEIRENAKRYCGFRQPKDTEVCNYGNCADGFVWKPDEWQPCEGECKNARQKRTLGCYNVNGTRVKNKHCVKSSLKPKKKRKCFSSPDCLPQSCSEIRNTLHKQENGNYDIEIKGKTVTIYCYGMDSSRPQEFINLKETNYAVIHSASLGNNFRSDTSDRCTINGGQGCDCNRSDFGYTLFSKVALNITSLEIITNDYTFSGTYNGKPVPFGTAGDCYRTSDCPQGIFVISLVGTDFKVSPKTSWRSKTGHGLITMHRIMNDQYIRGKCGGLCDTCLPDPQHGLLVDILLPL